jgi:hypothetical protein
MRKLAATKLGTIQGSVGGETETALGGPKLERRNAQIDQYTVRSIAPALGLENREQIGEFGLHDAHATAGGRVTGSLEITGRPDDRVGVSVDADDHAVGRRSG